MKKTVLCVGLFAVLIAIVSRPKEMLVSDPGASAVVITGCASGLGLALTLELAEKGYLVFAGVRRFPSDELDVGLQALSPQARELVVPIALDVASRPAVDKAVKTVREYLGTQVSKRALVGIVNNAGTNGNSRHILHVNPADFDGAFKTNVYGILHMVQLFTPMLLQPGGRIVNIGSLMGLFALKKSSPYSATKWALEGLSDSMRYDLHDSGLSVSLIEPGFFFSGMCQHSLCTDSPRDTVDAVIDALQSSRPQGRYATASVGVVPGWLVAYLRVLPKSVIDLVLSNVN